MGSSARNSSGVHWCRCWVRFNEVPEKVPEVPEKVCVALAEPGQVQQGSGKGLGAEPGQVLQEALVQSQVKFNGVPEKVPEKVGEALVQRQVRLNRILEKLQEKVPEEAPGCVQQGSGEGSGQVQQGSEEGSGEGSGRLWCRARSSFNRVPGKVPEEVWSGSGQHGEGSGEGSGRVWCRARAR